MQYHKLTSKADDLCHSSSFLYHRIDTRFSISATMFILTLWNALDMSIHGPVATKSMTIFLKCLKTNLFPTQSNDSGGASESLSRGGAI